MPSLSPALPLFAVLAVPSVALADSTEVLWFQGNNGYTGTDYTTLQETIEGLGGTFTATETMPDSLMSYRVVFLVNPARKFSPTHLDLLREYIAGDGLLVLLGNEGGEAGSLGVLMNTTDELGLKSTFVAEEHDAGCGSDGAGATATKDADSVYNECVNTLTYAGSAEISVGTGASSLFLGESDQVLIGLEDNVMLVADRDIFIDKCTFSGDNEALFKKVYNKGEAGSTDADCDGYGPESEGGDDCDDGDATVYPGAEDICDGLDNDCSGGADDDASYGTVWYQDSDDDGYGIDGGTKIACDDPDGYAGNTDDCNDGNASVYPGAEEVCNGADDDCDGTDDNDATDGTVWYADADEDGYGDTSVKETSCDQPGGYVAVEGDCDDTLARVNPEAVEICNSEDDNCDGYKDNDSTDATTWYTDADADGYGDPYTSVTTCEEPAGVVDNDDDCDDSDATIYPGADGWGADCSDVSKDTGEEKTEGCGCSATPSPSGWWMLAPIALLLGLRRRA